MAKPSFGPGSAVPKFERKIGLHPGKQTAPRRSRTTTPSSGMRGWVTDKQDPFTKWCSFWKAVPFEKPEPLPPDLSPSKQLPTVMKVSRDEFKLRKDVHEDTHWSLNHTNPKPEKLLRQRARADRDNPAYIEEVAALGGKLPQDFWNTADMSEDKTLMRNKNWCNLTRPRRLEPEDSPQRMWTPRARPKTPTSIELRQRGTPVRHICAVPSHNERDPNNKTDSKLLQQQVFGLYDPKHSFPVLDMSKSREYERYSDLHNDKFTGARGYFNPKDKFAEPVTTMMEVGFYAPDPEVYQPIGGMSPSKIDYLNGLPRISLAGGTPGRLCSPSSKFIDNVLMTRPDFVAF